MKNEKGSRHFYLLINVFLVTAIILNISLAVWDQRNIYFTFNYWDRFPYLKKLFLDSIYVNKNGNWISDEIIYAYNGGALITGVNPILVNPEVPPIGKYLIGLSAFLFNNENIINLLSVVFSLFLLYLVGKQIFKSSTLALISPFLITFEPIFQNQIIHTPLLDIIQLVFLLSIFYFFNKGFTNNKNIFINFILTSLFFGLFIGTKFFGLGITIVVALFSVLIFHKDANRIKLMIYTMPLSIFVLLLSYIRVLIIGYPFIKFLGIQKWILWYNQGHLHATFTMWPLLLLNQWYVSWDKRVLSDSQWQISWPIITLVTLCGTGLYVLKKIKHKKEIEVYYAWVIAYLGFLSLGDATARYFVILIPVLYLTALYTVVNSIKTWIHK